MRAPGRLALYLTTVLAAAACTTAPETPRPASTLSHGEPTQVPTKVTLSTPANATKSPEGEKLAAEFVALVRAKADPKLRLAETTSYSRQQMQSTEHTVAALLSDDTGGHGVIALERTTPAITRGAAECMRGSRDTCSVRTAHNGRKLVVIDQTRNSPDRRRQIIIDVYLPDRQRPLVVRAMDRAEATGLSPWNGGPALKSVPLSVDALVEIASSPALLP